MYYPVGYVVPRIAPLSYVIVWSVSRERGLLTARVAEMRTGVSGKSRDWAQWQKLWEMFSQKLSFSPIFSWVIIPICWENGKCWEKNSHDFFSVTMYVFMSVLLGSQCIHTHTLRKKREDFLKMTISFQII